MFRCVYFLVLALFLFPRCEADPGDDAPPISIKSPDTGSTFAFGTIKNHSLFWDKKGKMLIVRVTFTDDDQAFGQSNDDTHEFRLPGVDLDEAKGIFFATSAKGEVIPVAHFKKVLFLNSIETTRNAAVRIIHPKGGSVTVILEAISPDDPAMNAVPTEPSPGT